MIKINKKLAKDIEEKYPMWWECGTYNKYYIGLILKARSGFADTGHEWIHTAFATVSIRKASEIQEYLGEKGINPQGWRNAIEKYKVYCQTGKIPNKRDRIDKLFMECI